MITLISMGLSTIIGIAAGVKTYKYLKGCGPSNIYVDIPDSDVFEDADSEDGAE